MLKNSNDPQSAKLTDDVKMLAKKLGAEMIGVASVDRFKDAPLMHSPQGLMPTAKSVVVFGVTWLDASIELTEKEISEYFYNPGDRCESQTNMNERLYSIGFNLAKYLEGQKYRSLPLPSTYFWRWRPYKTMKDAFAPALAHRYAAVAAGLGEIGWHTSFISPNHGPRQRLNSIITEAPLVADPLYEDTPLCDKCMKCVKACPYDRFGKEVEGTKELQIGTKKFKIPITNPWRCYLCYTQINPRFMPDKITEEVAIRITTDGRLPRVAPLQDSAACLAACLPPRLRTKDGNLYSHSIARKRDVVNVDSREVTAKIKEMALNAGMDYLFIGGKDDLANKGLKLDEYMPHASSIVFFGGKYTNQFMDLATKEKVKNLLFDLSHYLQGLGYYTLPASRLDTETMKSTFGIQRSCDANFQHLITAMPLKSLSISVKTRKRVIKTSAEEIKSLALAKGADLVGITSVDRLNKIYSTLKSAVGNDKTIDAVNMPKIINARDMNFTAKGINGIKLKKPKDYLSNARSVIVIAIHYPYALIERAGKPPAEDIGSYKALDWFMPLEFYSVSYELVRFLKGKGYKAVPTLDLEGFSFPRHAPNRFAAVAAGLGDLGWCGSVLTPQYGATQRFVSIVTDAELEQDTLYEGKKLCGECLKCVERCPAKALSKNDRITIMVENRKFEFGRIDRLRCEWTNRFGFIGEEGPANMGSKINIMPPSEITSRSFNNAMDKVRELEAGERLNWDLTIDRCVCACPVRGDSA